MNSIRETAEQIIANPEGGTAHLVRSLLPTDGYFVGGAGTGLVFAKGATPDRYMLIQLMLRATSEYVGWWTDPESGRLYVDGATWVGSRSEANRMCVERGELAFYSIADGESYRPLR